MIYTANNKFNFRSPSHMGGGSAYYVYPDGNVHFDSVTRDSCGRCTPHRSPDTIGPSYSKDVTHTGEVMGNYANGSVGESYGIIFAPIKIFSFRSPVIHYAYSSNAYQVNSDGNVIYYYNATASCGRGSPDLGPGDVMSSWFIYTNGAFHVREVEYRSYGRSSPCLEHDRSDTYGVNVSGYVTDDYDVNLDSYGIQ